MISRFVKIVSNQCLVFRIVKKKKEDWELKLIFIDTRNVLKKKKPRNQNSLGLGDSKPYISIQKINDAKSKHSQAIVIHPHSLMSELFASFEKKMNLRSYKSDGNLFLLLKLKLK